MAAAPHPPVTARIAAAVPALLLAAACFTPPADPAAGIGADAGAEKADLTEGQALSYALGVNVARGLLRDGLDPDAELFLAGLRDTLTDRPLRLGEDELAAALDAAAAKVRDAAAEREAARVAGASEVLLNDFAADDGVRTLPGGVLVKEVSAGSGAKPGAGDRVRLHYAVTVAGADVPFFSTRGGDPAVAAVADMLPGLRSALPTMPAGSRWRLAVPASAGYGEAGGPGVPPGAALLLDVELLGVLPPAGPARPAADE